MTPAGIKLGRQFDAVTRAYTIADAETVSIAPGDSNRVAVVVSLNTTLCADPATGIVVGVQQGGAITPLTVLSNGSPKCHLSVDTMGSAIFPELFVVNGTGAAAIIGVTIVRQVQELP